MDYLSTNPSKEVVSVMQLVLRQSVLKRLDQWGLVVRRLQIDRLLRLLRFEDAENMQNRNLLVEEIESKMSWYEFLESTSLLE